MDLLLLISRDGEVLEALTPSVTELRLAILVFDGDPQRLPALRSKTFAAVILDEEAFPTTAALEAQLHTLKGRYPSAFTMLLSKRADPAIRTLGAEFDLCVRWPSAPGQLSGQLRSLGTISSNQNEKSALTQEVRRVHDIEFDVGLYSARFHGRKLPLTLTEFTLLEVLARTPGRTVRHEALGNALWGWDSDNYCGHLRCHISRLRSKLQRAQCTMKIISVRGVGYAMERAGK